jgi:hypothetical protein
VLFVVKLDDMGKTSASDLVKPAGNYAKLLSAPIFFTYYPPELSPHPDDIRTLNVLWGGVTHHLHGNPVFWNSPDRGPLVYCWGENGNLRAWSLHAVRHGSSAGVSSVLIILMAGSVVVSRDRFTNPDPSCINRAARSLHSV